MIWYCANCKVPMAKSQTEDGTCPTCGLKMGALPNCRDEKFDIMLTALLYGKKP